MISVHLIRAGFFFLNVRWNYCIVKNFVCSYVMPVVWLFILLLKERKNPTDPLSHFKSAGLHVHKAYFFSVSSLIWKYFLISCYISNHSLGHIRLFFNSHDFLIAYFKKSLPLFFWLHCIKFHVSFVYELSIIIKQMICLSSSNLSQS